MMDKNCVFRFCLMGLFCSIIFSKHNVLWDFGVVIRKPSLQNNPKDIPPQYPTTPEIFQTKINAVNTDPFIPPIRSTFLSKISDPLVYKFPENITEFTSEINIYQIELMVKKYYLKKNYQYVIKLLHKRDLSMLSEHVHSDLEYLLASAFYHTGEYKKAQNYVLSLLKQNKTDRLYLLLAMIYESLGEINTAKKYYLKLATQYPDSDYIISAKIKSSLLGQH